MKKILTATLAIYLLFIIGVLFVMAKACSADTSCDISYELYLRGVPQMETLNCSYHHADYSKHTESKLEEWLIPIWHQGVYYTINQSNGLYCNRNSCLGNEYEPEGDWLYVDCLAYTLLMALEQEWIDVEDLSEY